ncbi:hypothetical protein GF361_01995 [Candidatus Woesearchaeota archaeon]|nr:hypothetical protein [Candidatus Woesearchaeota archaeon]
MAKYNIKHMAKEVVHAISYKGMSDKEAPIRFKTMIINEPSEIYRAHLKKIGLFPKQKMYQAMIYIFGKRSGLSREHIDENLAGDISGVLEEQHKTEVVGEGEINPCFETEAKETIGKILQD